MKALKINKVAEVKLVYITKVRTDQRPRVTKSSECYQLLLANWDKDTIELQERFKVLLMNNANRVLGIYEAAAGGIGETIADVRLILIAALKASATGMILSHNHPSGSTIPSEPDRALTRRICEAAKLLGIRVLDHMIVTSSSYYSFADQGEI